MNYSKSGLALTESFEGCRLSAYQDQVGVWTIGYGHTKYVRPFDKCTQEQAEKWLQEDVQEAVDMINQHVKVALTQGQFDALVDFVFNLGGVNFEHSTLFMMLNQGNFEGAADQFERWAYAGGQKVAGLLRRRQAEEAEFKEA